MARKQHKRQKTVPYTNKKNVGTLKNDAATAKDNETTQDQLIIEASYNAKTGKVDFKGSDIPISVKEEFVKFFK